ncbi:hypothetical protein DWB68_10195 [Galactobacter valiniphilus]|uniref:Uncharacterized protein n=1 Tax=Galactobacter valiniphilus TaxID=2676122 RepID=A0A399J8P4_9MICC|nr:hypothetical protein [Galactobacter valiniphilus]RII41888.1 hypothetical protein DWB68_10195 [Galactobacter valiniphilus]
MALLNSAIYPTTVINKGIEATLYYGIGKDSPMSQFMAGCGFDPERTAASDMIVNLDEHTVTARVYRYTENGQRVVGSGGYLTTEVTRPLVGTLPPSDYATDLIMNPVEVLEMVFAEHFGWDERNDDAIKAITAALFPRKES